MKVTKNWSLENVKKFYTDAQFNVAQFFYVKNLYFSQQLRLKFWDFRF